MNAIYYAKYSTESIARILVLQLLWSASRFREGNFEKDTFYACYCYFGLCLTHFFCSFLMFSSIWIFCIKIQIMISVDGRKQIAGGFFNCFFKNYWKKRLFWSVYLYKFWNHLFAMAALKTRPEGDFSEYLSFWSFPLKLLCWRIIQVRNRVFKSVSKNALPPTKRESIYVGWTLLIMLSVGLN